MDGSLAAALEAKGYHPRPRAHLQPSTQHPPNGFGLQPLPSALPAHPVRIAEDKRNLILQALYAAFLVAVRDLRPEWAASNPVYLELLRRYGLNDYHHRAPFSDLFREAAKLQAAWSLSSPDILFRVCEEEWRSAGELSAYATGIAVPPVQRQRCCKACPTLFVPASATALYCGRTKSDDANRPTPPHGVKDDEATSIMAAWLKEFKKLQKEPTVKKICDELGSQGPSEESVKRWRRACANARKCFTVSDLKVTEN